MQQVWWWYQNSLNDPQTTAGVETGSRARKDTPVHELGNLVHKVISLAAVLVIVAGCTAEDTIPPSIVVGVLSAATGPGAGPDDAAAKGAQLAIEVVNESYALPIPLAGGIGLPGLHGARLTLVTGDTKGQLELATQQAHEFVTVRKAVGVVLADSAEVAMTTASEMQRLRVPLLDACNTADHLTELGMDWYFRAVPGDRSMVEGAFALLGSQGVARIAVLTEPLGDSPAGLAHIQAVAGAAGTQILSRHELGAADATDAIGASGGAQAIVAWAHTATGAAQLRELVARVPSAPPIVGLGKGFRDLTQLSGSTPMMVRTVLWSADLAGRSPAAKAVAQLYEKRFGQAMSGVAAATFTSVIALAVAIDSGGSADTAAIRAALRQTALPPTQMIMPWDGVRFATDGHNSLASSALEAWDGAAFRVVYPMELATQALRWPGAPR